MPITTVYMPWANFNPVHFWHSTGLLSLLQAWFAAPSSHSPSPRQHANLHSARREVFPSSPDLARDRAEVPIHLHFVVGRAGNSGIGSVV